MPIASLLTACPLCLAPCVQNKFASTPPAAWSTLSHLYELDLGSNRLAGTLPAAWSALGKMALLHLDTNPQLYGQVPPAWQTSMLLMEQLNVTDTAVRLAWRLHAAGLHDLALLASESV